MAGAARGLSPFPIEDRAAIREAWVAARRRENAAGRGQAATAVTVSAGRSIAQ
jgi:hypothetical protein